MSSGSSTSAGRADAGAPDHALNPTRRPGLFDYLDLFALRLVKRGRARRDGDDTFYDSFFTEDDVEKYRLDVRNAFRFWHVEDCYRDLYGDRAVRVADIGAGLGVAVDRLPTGADYVGIEFSAHSIALARRLHAGRKAVFREGGFPDLPLDSGGADFAICLEVVEHVPDDAAAAAELFRILRPGGHLLISVPGTWYWPDYQDLIGHYRHYARGGLEALLRDAGFEVVRGFPQHERFWRFYHYLYLCLKAFEIAVRRTVWRDYSVLRSGFARWLARRIEARLRPAPPGDDPTATFLLCRKPAKAPA